MSRENVEIIRLWLRTLNAEAEEMRAGVMKLCDDDIDFYPVRKFPEARPRHGREEMLHFLVQFREAFSRFEFALRSVIKVGDDRVLACANLRAEGRGSGLNLEGDLYPCFWLRHGRIIREEDHLTVSGALYALGLEGETLEAIVLSEQHAHADS